MYTFTYTCTAHTHAGQQIDRFTVCVHTRICKQVHILFMIVCIFLHIFALLLFLTRQRTIKRNRFSCSFLCIRISFIVLITYGAMRIGCACVCVCVWETTTPQPTIVTLVNTVCRCKCAITTITTKFSCAICLQVVVYLRQSSLRTDKSHYTRWAISCGKKAKQKKEIYLCSER